MKMFNWRQVMHVHLYLGLFCLPYLLIFGLSSLDFNHHFFLRDPYPTGESRVVTLEIPPIADDRELGEALRDSLGLFGWYLPWDTHRDSALFVTKISQPGKDYHLKAFLTEGKIEISENKKRAGQILRILHFMGESLPSAPWWINLWQYYQALTAYSIVFWVISGVYLWWRKKNSHPAEKAVLLGMAIFSLSYIIFLWLAG